MASRERDALVAVFRATGGPRWKQSENWDTENDVSTWFGVEVNDQGHVVKLQLTNNNLTGILGVSCMMTYLGSSRKSTHLDDRAWEYIAYLNLRSFFMLSLIHI